MVLARFFPTSQPLGVDENVKIDANYLPVRSQFSPHNRYLVRDTFDFGVVVKCRNQRQLRIGLRASSYCRAPSLYCMSPRNHGKPRPDHPSTETCLTTCCEMCWSNLPVPCSQAEKINRPLGETCWPFFRPIISRAKSMPCSSAKTARPFAFAQVSLRLSSCGSSMSTSKPPLSFSRTIMKSG